VLVKVHGSLVAEMGVLMKERLSYLDFDLKIERNGENFSARLLHSPSGEASSLFNLPFTEKDLELLLLKMGNTRARVRGVRNPKLAAASELGGELFDAVFRDRVAECFYRSLDKARAQQKGLRLKLRLQDVPELANLPWEFLFDRSNERFLAKSNQTPIIRYIEIGESVLPLEVKLPLQILVMISSPVDQEPLDVELEKAHLDEALSQLKVNDLVQVDWLEEATLQALQRQLNQKDYHIFHFIGHGGFDERTNEGVLVLEDQYERSLFIDAHQIGTLLHDHLSLRLVVLNSCEGARNSISDPFASVAAHLIRQGVPSVVAMQFEITDISAITFASQFYSALCMGFPVDAAVSEARKAIYSQPNETEWGTPVLYMRSTDGILFRLAEAPVKLPAAQPNPVAVPREEKVPRPIKPTVATELRSNLPSSAPASNVSHHFVRPTWGTVTYNGHQIEVNDSGLGFEIIKYNGRPVSEKFSIKGADHIFRVDEDGQQVQYVVSLSRNSSGCEITRNGVVIYTNLLPSTPMVEQGQLVTHDFKSPKKGAITYKGHCIDVHDTGYGPEIVKYDGKVVSKKASLSGTSHVFRVEEDGESVQYIVKFSGRGCEITRNGVILFTNI
jgi:hypothetical protein